MIQPPSGITAGDISDVGPVEFDPQKAAVLPTLAVTHAEDRIADRRIQYDIIVEREITVLSSPAGPQHFPAGGSGFPVGSIRPGLRVPVLRFAEPGTGRPYSDPVEIDGSPVAARRQFHRKIRVGNSPQAEAGEVEVMRLIPPSAGSAEVQGAAIIGVDPYFKPCPARIGTRVAHVQIRLVENLRGKNIPAGEFTLIVTPAVPENLPAPGVFLEIIRTAAVELVGIFAFPGPPVFHHIRTADEPQALYKQSSAAWERERYIFD